jgi:hypothetical protein
MRDHVLILYSIGLMREAGFCAVLHLRSADSAQCCICAVLHLRCADSAQCYSRHKRLGVLVVSFRNSVLSFTLQN